MIKEDNIIVPRWFLETIEDTLQIQHNINEPDKKKTGESCQDRNIKESLNGVRKLLNGEELTGMERLEKLHPSLSSNLDEAANKANFEKPHSLNGYKAFEEAFKAGAEWLAEQDNMDSMKEALRIEYEKGRNDALKDLPRWKRFAPSINDPLSEQQICKELENSVLRVDAGGYYWTISREELNKLPKENEK